MVERDIGKEKNQPTGLVLELPLRFQLIPPEFPDKQPDRVVGILVETDGNRRQLLKELAKVIKGGIYMSVIHVDVDWLKYLNDSVGRDLGDQAIKHSVFAVAEEIDKTFPQDTELKIRLFRDGPGADETWFYLLGLSEEQLNLLGELKEQISTKPEIPLPNKAGRGISFSAGVSHSGEDQYKRLLERTKVALENNQLNLPFNLFQQLQEDASSEAHKIKLEKISRMVNRVSNQKNFDDFKKTAAKELSGLRLESATLEYLLEEAEKRGHKQ